MPPTVSVEITIGSVSSRFAGEGDPATIVAMFRTWLAEPFRVAVPASFTGQAFDDVDRGGAAVFEAAKMRVQAGQVVEDVARATGIDAERLRPWAVPLQPLDRPQAPPSPEPISAPQSDSAPAGPQPPAQESIATPGQAAAQGAGIPKAYQDRRVACEAAVLRAATLAGRAPGELRDEVVAQGFAPVGVKQAVNRLVTAGQLRRIGQTAATRLYLVPAVEAKAPAGDVIADAIANVEAGRPIAARVPPPVELKSPRELLDQRRADIRRWVCSLMNDGMRREFKTILAHVHAHGVPEATFEDLRAVLGLLIHDKQIGVASVGLERRYQKRSEVRELR